jgi:nucleotide-binding universal stress UspA family protein
MAVIVGVDGSEESRKALSWAADEARMRGEALVAVHVYVSPAVYYPFGEFPGGPDTRILEDARRAAEDLLSDEVATVRDRLDGVHVEKKVVEDEQPARALTQEAGRSDLLVVGSRGRGGFKGLLLGSVSQQVAHHAPCPIVVIRHHK